MSASPPMVYVVDDDASFLKAVARLLRAGGYKAATFASAADFLGLPIPDAPGCLIVDLQMPGLSGLELQEALAKADNPLPLVFLTGHGDIPTSVQAMRQGAEDFLTKPVDPAHLLIALHHMQERISQLNQLEKAVKQQAAENEREAGKIRLVPVRTAIDAVIKTVEVVKDAKKALLDADPDEALVKSRIESVLRAIAALDKAAREIFESS